MKHEETPLALKSLGVKGTAQRVFTHLAESGISPVTAISEVLRIPKASVYDSLNELSSLGLIVEYSENRSKEYGAISTEQLNDLVAKKIREIKSAGDALAAFMKSSSGKQKGPTKPKIKFYTGSEGIRQAFRDTMWHSKCKETYLMWPTTEMVDILTPEFSAWHSAQRLQHGVMMYAIRKHTERQMEKTMNKHSELYESAGWKNSREVRYAPKGDSWTMSYWIYDDKCLFASSAGEEFAFIVQSREFASLMKLLWQNTWKQCEK